MINYSNITLHKSKPWNYLVKTNFIKIEKIMNQQRHAVQLLNWALHQINLSEAQGFKFHWKHHFYQGKKCLYPKSNSSPTHRAYRNFIDSTRTRTTTTKIHICIIIFKKQRTKLKNLFWAYNLYMQLKEQKTYLTWTEALERKS